MTDQDTIFCKCGLVAKYGKFCSLRCKSKKPKPPKKGKWSGYSKWKAQGGYNAE